MDEYYVELNKEIKKVEANNPLMAAIKAFPKTFEHPIYQMDMHEENDNDWRITLRSAISYVGLEVRMI